MSLLSHESTSRRSRSSTGVWWARIALSLAALAMLLPLIYQTGLSFKAPDEVYSSALSPLPTSPTLENYSLVLRVLPMGRYLLNSVLFTLCVALGQLLLALPAAYALSSTRFRGQRLALGATLLTLMVPFVVTYVPNYLTVASWGMIGTLPGMVLPMLGGVGYPIFLLRQHFASFPQSILEAARVDGANPLQILLYVLIPAHRAAISSTFLYLLIYAWNQFIWPLLVSKGEMSYTLTVGVQRFAGGEGGNAWGPMMAAATLACLPTVLLYLALRRGVLTTFSEGAVKG